MQASYFQLLMGYKSLALEEGILMLPCGRAFESAAALVIAMMATALLVYALISARLIRRSFLSYFSSEKTRQQGRTAQRGDQVRSEVDIIPSLFFFFFFFFFLSSSFGSGQRGFGANEEQYQRARNLSTCSLYL